MRGATRPVLDALAGGHGHERRRSSRSARTCATARRAGRRCARCASRARAGSRCCCPFAWLSRGSSSRADVAQYAASSGGGRLGPAAALIGLCLSGVGAGAACVMTGALPAPPIDRARRVDPAPAPKRHAARTQAGRQSPTRTPTAPRTPAPPRPSPPPPPARRTDRGREARRRVKAKAAAQADDDERTDKQTRRPRRHEQRVRLRGHERRERPRASPRPRAPRVGGRGARPSGGGGEQRGGGGAAQQRRRARAERRLDAERASSASRAAERVSPHLAARDHARMPRDPELNEYLTRLAGQDEVLARSPARRASCRTPGCSRGPTRPRC